MANEIDNSAGVARKPQDDGSELSEALAPYVNLAPERAADSSATDDSKAKDTPDSSDSATDAVSPAKKSSETTGDKNETPSALPRLDIVSESSDRPSLDIPALELLLDSKSTSSSTLSGARRSRLADFADPASGRPSLTPKNSYLDIGSDIKLGASKGLFSGIPASEVTSPEAESERAPVVDAGEPPFVEGVERKPAEAEAKVARDAGPKVADVPAKAEVSTVSEVPADVEILTTVATTGDEGTPGKAEEPVVVDSKVSIPVEPANAVPVEVEKPEAEIESDTPPVAEPLPVKSADGTGEWVSGGEGGWSFLDARGIMRSAHPDYPDKTVADVSSQDDGSTLLKFSDGSLLREHKNGAKLHFSDQEAFEKGRPDRVVNADKSAVDVKWDGKKIASLKHSSGEEQFQVGDDVWSLNARSARGQNGRIEIDGRTGDLSRTYLDGPDKGLKQVFHADGSVSAFKPDGSMSLEVDLPGGTKTRFEFDKSFSGDRKSLSEPTAITLIDGSGKETRYVNQGDNAYKSDSETIHRKVIVSESGAFSLSDLDSDSSIKSDGKGLVTVSGDGSEKQYRAGKLESHTYGKEDISIVYDEAAVQEAPATSPQSGERNGRFAQLADGSYERDENDRVISTESADGTLKRKFEYADPKDPKKVTAITIGDTTYKYLAPITSSGKPVNHNGMEMASYSIYQNGSLKDHFSGFMGVSENGSFTKLEYFKNKEKIVEGADGKKLSAEEQKSREENGIWSGLPGWKQEQARTSEPEPREIRDAAHNRLWKKSEDGKWTADPLDSELPYEAPGSVEAEILSAGKLTIDQRLALSESASKFESSANLTDEQQSKYRENVAKQLATVDKGFEGRYEIDPLSGGFTKVTTQGERKGVRETARFEGYKQVDNPDGSTEITIKYPNQTTPMQFKFKEGFSADRQTLSRPESVSFVDSEGKEETWKHEGGSEYSHNGEGKERYRFELKSDGTYRWKNVDSGTGALTTLDGREESMGEGLTTIKQDGRLVGYRAGEHQFDVKTSAKGDISELSHINENRVWLKDSEGRWQAKPIDDSKPYSEPSDLEADIFTAEKLDFSQRIKLVDSARSFESAKHLSDERQDEYLANVRKHMSAADPSFKGHYEIDSRTGGFVTIADAGARKGVRDIHRVDGVLESRFPDGSMELDIKSPDGSSRLLRFKEGFTDEKQRLEQPESITVHSTDGKTYGWKRTGDDTYEVGGATRKQHFSVGDDGSYTYRDLTQKIATTMLLDGRVEKTDTESGESNIFKGDVLVGVKAEGQEISMTRDAKGKPDTITHVNENRVWTRNENGEWSAEPKDKKLPYEEPSPAEASILASENVPFSSRLSLVADARKFAERTDLDGEGIKSYLSNVESQLGAVPTDFKGTLGIDADSGAFQRTAADGPRKGITDNFRIDGIRESHLPGGKVEVEVPFADGTKREFTFKGSFTDKITALSQPEQLKVTSPDGTEHLWKHVKDDEYNLNGDTKKAKFTLTKDGNYIYERPESGYRIERSRDGDIEENDPESGVHTKLEDGHYTYAKLSGQEFSMSYEADGSLSRLEHKTENRVWTKDTEGRWSDSPLDETAPFEKVSGFEKEMMVHSELDPMQKARLIENIRSFESSTKFTDTQKQQVIEHARSLLTEKSDAAMTAKERAGYVDQLFWHIAHPKRTEQGSNNSCNVTVIRGIALRERPEVVAKLVADVANNGKFTALDGTTIVPPMDSVRPRDGSVEASFPPPPGSRTALGKLWDVAAINTYYQRATKDNLGVIVPKGSLSYGEVPSTGRGDTGNRLYKSNSDGSLSQLTKKMSQSGKIEPYDGPYMFPDRVADVYHQLMGESVGARMLTHKDRYVGDATLFNAEIGDKIQDSASLKARLDWAAANDKFPLIVQGTTSILERKYKEQKAVSEGKDKSTVGPQSGGEHVWLVSGFDTKTGTVSIDNSWNPDYDIASIAEVIARGGDVGKHISMSMDDLFESMQKSSSSGEGFTFFYQKVEASPNEKLVTGR